MISHKVQPSFPSSFFRREAIARIGTLVCGSYLFGGTVGVIAADTLYPTPAQIEGPFYPKIMPAEAGIILKYSTSEARAVFTLIPSVAIL